MFDVFALNVFEHTHVVVGLIGAVSTEPGATIFIHFGLD